MAARRFLPENRQTSRSGVAAIESGREPGRATVPAPPRADLLASSVETLPEILAVDDLDLVDALPEPEPEPEFDPSGVFVAPLGEADFGARGGSMQAVPIVRKTADEIRKLPLDPASAFLLGAMDGMVNVETLMDLVPLSREDVVRSLCLLVDHDVIHLI